jgi:hypothetical protein
MGLAAHQFIDAAGRCPCLSAPDPRSARRALAAPLKGPRTALSSVIMEGIGFPVRGERAGFAGAIHRAVCHVTETLQPLEKPRLRFPKGTDSAILCGQVADDGEGPKTTPEKQAPPVQRHKRP